jgi:YVTN family beta-propeller protein
MAVNPSANRIYVANQGSNSVSVIDGATNLVVATVTVGSQPAGIAVNPNTGRVYVTNTSAGTVSVIDGTKNVVTATVGVGTNPKGVAVNTTSDRVFVANSGSSSVSVIDGVTNAVVGTVTVGLAPYGVAANPNTNRVYVANSGNGTVSLIEDPVDWDRDGVLDSVDNCPYVYNPDQQASHYGPRSAGPRIPGGRASNPASNPQGDACYVTLPQPPCDRSADTDGDGILDCLEHKYNTCAYAGDPYPGYTSCVNPSDSDGDNCPDWLEIMDINGDRTVDGTDQLLLARRASGQIPPDPVSDAIFDVNKDGKINVADQYLMGINTCDYRRSHGYTGPCPCSPE